MPKLSTTLNEPKTAKAPTTGAGRSRAASAVTNFHEITVNSRSWGDLKGHKILITDSLYARLESATARDGSTFITRLEGGRAVRGLKHLVSSITSVDKSARLILTDQPSLRSGSDFFINLDAYIAAGQAAFFALYRQTGLSVAAEFLSKAFPGDFAAPSTSALNRSELKRASDHIGQTVDDLTKTVSGRKKLLKELSGQIREQREQKKRLRSELEELNELRRQSSIAYYMEKLEELKDRLTKSYPETSGKNSWQRWIYENNWVMGILYNPPFEKEKIGFGSIPDYLFPTIDGFIDILEIKKPEHAVIRKDDSHSGSYAWSAECNLAIGQSANYIYEMELNQLQLVERINERYGSELPGPLSVIRPRAFVLIGRSDDWSSPDKKAFRKLNHTLHGIEVVTYSDLVRRAERLIALYADAATPLSD